jgi:uncharacterized peroxidase-related enzyme
MAWIEQVPDDRAEGLLAQLYAAARQRAGKVYNIVRIMSPNPAVMRESLAFYRALMFGESPLSRGLRELLAVVTSRVNHCRY